MSWLAILYSVFPATCISCRAKSCRHFDLCAGCQRDFPRIRNACWQCGLGHSAPGELCNECKNEPKLYSHIFSGFCYDWPVDRLIHRFKFHNNAAIGLVLSTLLARRYLRQHILMPDLWVPVPLHPTRQRQRGFNQSEFIAQILARESAVAIDNRLASRVVSTRNQADLSAQERQVNVRNAFKINKPIEQKSIAIVDDVVTTASTVTELSHCLLEHGAADVQIVCLARTPEK